MPSPSDRPILWILLTVLLLVLVREWNIRRHEPGLESWPRVGEQARLG